MASEAATTDIGTEIIRINHVFENTFAQGDAAALAALYTETGMLLPAGSSAIQGRKGIQEYWQQAMNMGVKQVKLHTIEVEDLEITAVELGSYTLNAENGNELDHGKYLAIWKKESGNWKLQRDIWTSSKSGI